MKRAIRKNTLGKSIDTICGRVKGKKVSGEDTEDRPFLYLVKEDEAYVVNGPAGSAAAIAYRNICTASLEQQNRCQDHCDGPEGPLMTFFERT